MSSLGTLCLSCGLCCNGALFGRVAVSEDEAARLRVLGLHVLHPPDEQPLFVQPCAALEEDLRCRVYEARPETCRKFNCLVASALVDREIDLPEALRTVARARQEIREKGRVLAEPFLRRVLLGRSSAPR